MRGTVSSVSVVDLLFVCRSPAIFNRAFSTTIRILVYIFYSVMNSRYQNFFVLCILSLSLCRLCHLLLCTFKPQHAITDHEDPLSSGSLPASSTRFCASNSSPCDQNSLCESTATTPCRKWRNNASHGRGQQGRPNGQCKLPVGECDLHYIEWLSHIILLPISHCSGQMSWWNLEAPRSPISSALIMSPTWLKIRLR